MIALIVPCRDCGRALSAIEIKYYLDRCEACEKRWSERMEAWRHGGEDAELSRLYPDEPRTLQ